jgi:photosystem II stability/assembly factor-like uncharacterized protein
MPRGYTPVSVQFVGQATGFAIAARIQKPDNLAQSTLLLRTEDGGRHWSVISLP